MKNGVSLESGLRLDDGGYSEMNVLFILLLSLILSDRGC